MIESLKLHGFVEELLELLIVLGFVSGGGRRRHVSADVVDSEFVVDGRLEARLHVAPSAHVFVLLLTPRHL